MVGTTCLPFSERSPPCAARGPPDCRAGSLTAEWVAGHGGERPPHVIVGSLYDLGGFATKVLPHGLALTAVERDVPRPAVLALGA